jgi:hypothetical protein
VALAQQPVSHCHLAHQAKQQGEGELGHRLRGRAGHANDLDAASGGGRDIDDIDVV